MAFSKSIIRKVGAQSAVPLQFFIAVVVLCSCGMLHPLKPLGIPPIDPPEYHIKGVPFYPAEGMRCGPASVAAVLSYYGMDAASDEIAAGVMESEEIGAYHQNLYLYASSRGMSVQMYSGGVRDLKRMIAMGRPVIILLDLSLPTENYGHYILVVGYDEDNFYVYDGVEKDRKVSRRVIYGTWQRTDFFTLLILPTGTPLPPTSAELIQEALTHEGNGEWEDAEHLYRLALERGDVNIAAMIGVGNARLRLGDPEGAIAWYRLALRNDRKRTDARINMAAAYLKLGKTARAGRLIHKMLEQPTPFRPYALDTLGDILRAEGKIEEALRAYLMALENPPPGDDSFLQTIQRKIDELERGR